MHRKTVRRRAAALVLVAALGLAGARPAAADESGRIPGSLVRLAGFWEEWSEILERSGLGEGIGGLVSFWQTVTSDSGSDKGLGTDPNGNSLSGGVTSPAGDGR